MVDRFHPHSWQQKFRHAFRGLKRAIGTQHSFAVHLPVAGLVLLAGGLLRVSPAEWCLLVLAIGLVLVAETLNTAVESLARAVRTGFHPRLRDALDIASGAVLLASATAMVVGLVVFLPKLVRLFTPW